MCYKMFIDDERNPQTDGWIVCRSTQEAISFIVANGWPTHFSFDHDLGGEDTVMCFLKRLYQIWQGETIPSYVVHSANPIGAKNIVSFLESWKMSLTR